MAPLFVEPLEMRRLLAGATPQLAWPVARDLGGSGSPLSSPRQMEYLNRGLVAIRQSTNATGNIYVGWRMLGTDPPDIGFNLYCSTNGGAAVKLNGATPLTATTDFIHAAQNYSQSHTYFVRPVINGVEQPASETFTLPANAPANQYLSVPLEVPPGGMTPDGVNYTYNANDASVGDLDGDGEYEIVLKWDPSNAKDNSQAGYTGNVYIDAYKLNGTRLWRIDLGINIRAGAHYTQFMVYDLDGDGLAEVAMKTAPGTIDGQGNPVILPGDDPNADYRNSSGYILSGPEYLTVFNGATGAAMATVNYIVPRGSVSSWGDSYGNRVDRFLAAVAYLDGQRPSLVMARGYYTRATLAAWDYRNGQLTLRWLFDSNTPGNGGYAGQGNHNLSVADVDFDGKDEIIYGAAAIDDDGTGLHTTRWGHGDALHVSDFVPWRAGLEVFDIHEPGYPNIGASLRDGATGQAIFTLDQSTSSTEGPGRGVAGDIWAGNPGAEFWVAGGGIPGGAYNSAGVIVGDQPSSVNFLVWWDADPLRELLDSNRIDKYNPAGTDARLLTASGASSNNGTKSTPSLSADILGDWREEVIWRASDNSHLRIYTTTIPATSRMYTLMHDPQYRLAIAWQNVAYNQPPHPSFFIGDGMAPPPVPNIYLAQSGLTAPAPPAGLSATPGAAGTRAVSLVWQASDGATAYRVRRATTSGGPYTTIAGGIADTGYLDTAVAPGQTYYYVVNAVGPSMLESSDSNQAAASVPSGVQFTLQAESASFGGGTVFETTNGNFNGTGYVNFSASGGFLQFDNVNGGIGGLATVRFRYALGSSSSRSGVLIVNGVSQPITFNPTGGWSTWQLQTLTLDLRAGSTNTIRLESNGQDLANIDELRLDVIGDTTAPLLTAGQFWFETAPLRVSFTFSEDVSQSLSLATLLVSEPGGGGGAYGATSYSYEAATNTATFTLPTPLPDGNYRARLAAAAVRDPAGNPLATDALVDFFVLGGDANRDRAVNQLDLDILTMNWQQSPRTFSQGDFSYDGRVDTRDLLILTSHWQGTLPSPAQPMRLAWPSPAQRLPWRMPAAQRDESNVLLAGELL